MSDSNNKDLREEGTEDEKVGKEELAAFAEVILEKSVTSSDEDREHFMLVDVLKKVEVKLQTDLTGAMSELSDAALEASPSKEETASAPINNFSDKSSKKKKKNKKNKNKNGNNVEDNVGKSDTPEGKNEPVAAINSFTDVLVAIKPQAQNAVSDRVGAIAWADKHSAVYSNDVLPEHQRDFHLVHRNRSELEDLSVMHTYLGYKKAYDSGRNGWDVLLDYKTDEKIGTIPHIKLSLAWDLAKRYNGYENDFEVGVKYGITFSEWQVAVKVIEKYIRNSDIEVEGVNKNVTILLQHLFKVPTLNYQLLFIKKGDKVFDVVRDAILCDIQETAKAAKQWRKIKNYKYKVPLHTENGGIFSGEDVNRLHAGMGIRFLNDICMYNVYDLKSQSLDHPFGSIVKEINAAFREDKQKRRDRALQKYPFIVGNIALLLLTVLAYVFRYTLIKNSPMTVIVNIASSAWVLMNLVIVWACMRSKLRKKKIPDYAYMTKKTRKCLTWMSIFALFVVSSLICFYQRYDGYDAQFYYRDIGEGEVAIAGLVDKDLAEIEIPETMDGKTVTKIDLYAFDGEVINAAKLPSTVAVIANSAFKNCTSLVRVSYVNKEGNAPLVIEKKAFKGCSELDDCSVIANATTIAKKAFKDCYSIAKVDGFENVKHVGNEAFYGCTALQTVDLANVLSIGKKSFYGCYSLSDVYISDTVTEIGKDAFSSCSSVTNLVIPYFGKNLESSATSSLDYYFNCTERSADTLSVTVNGVDTVCRKNFENCVDVTDIVLGESVTSIEAGAFKGSEIYTITLSPSITSIGEETFAGCAYLTTVDGAVAVSSIGKNAFRNCGSITSLNLSGTVSVGEEAFYNCSSLYSISFGSALTAIGNSALRGCSSLGELDLSGTAVSVIGSDAFKDCTQLSTAKLPDSLTSLPAGIFNGCGSLSSVSLGVNLTAIGAEAFQKSAIGNLDFTKIKEIGNSAFNGCFNITEVVIPNDIQLLGRNAFANCASLTTFTGPFSVGGTNHNCDSILLNSGVVTLTVTKLDTAGENFLGNLGGVNTVVFDCELISIGSSAFEGDYNLTSITLPDTLKTIESKAFYDCDGLKSITIPASVTAIKAEAFAECDYITSIVIPDGVTVIENGVFEACTSLTSVTIPDSVTEIKDYAFNGCGNLGSIQFPTSLTVIGKSAFTNCSGLSDIEFGSGLTKIGEDAFRGCSNLTEIVIPDTVTVIEANAFRDCSCIETAVVSSKATLIGTGIFSGCDSLASLTIPFLGSSSSLANSITHVTDSSYLTEIVITGAKKLAKDSFKNLNYLTLVVLNDGITSVGENSFSGCSSLTRVVLPSESVWETYKTVFEGVPVYESMTSEESYAEKEARLEAEEAAKNEAQGK